MGKVDADAPSAASKGFARASVGGDGDRQHAGGNHGPSSAPPSSPIAPSTPTRRFENFKKIRFLKKNAEGSNRDSNREGVDLSTKSTTNAATALENDIPSSSSLALAAAPANARELRDHVAKFTTRSNWLGALVVAETAVGWLLTAAAPTLFDRFVVARSRSDAVEGAPPSSAALAFFASTAPSLLFYLAWGALRACSYIRTVILMHDLVHGIVFTSRRLNAVAATVAGLCAFTSAANFGRNHRRHHARLGVEEEIDFDADHTVFWTVKEWSAWRPGASKALARVLRDPVVYHFVTAPAYLLFFGSTCPGKSFFFFFFPEEAFARVLSLGPWRRRRMGLAAQAAREKKTKLAFRPTRTHDLPHPSPSLHKQATARACQHRKPFAASSATTGCASSASSAASARSPASAASPASSSSCPPGGSG